MSDMPLPEAESRSEKRVVEDVVERGWHVVKVPPEGDTPGWAFTIGLLHNYGHPEIILFGLPLDTAHELLNIAGEAIRQGRVFTPGLPYDDFLDGFDCVLKQTEPRWHAALVGYATWLYKGSKFPLLQLFWPDREGVMPWEPNASRWQREHQPLLFATTPEQARIEAILRTMRATD